MVKQTIGTTLTAVAQVIDFSHSGAESEVFDGTTLDSSASTNGVGREMIPTGVCSPGTFDLSLFFDPALAGHQAISDQLTGAATANWSIEFADAATTTATFDVAGVAMGFSGVIEDGLKADVSLTLDQNFSWPT